MVFARAGRDVSFVLSDWNEGISRWRFNLPAASYDGPYIATAVFDRTLVRAGETVHMKHLYRQHDARGLPLRANRAALPRKLRPSSIRAASSATRCRSSGTRRNSAELDWEVPQGRQDRRLPGAAWRTRWAGQARQRERPAPSASRSSACRSCARASNRRSSRWSMPTSAELGVQVSYLAGGGASLRAGQAAQRGAAARGELARLRRVPLANGAVKEGVQDGSPRRLVPGRVRAVGRRGTEAPLAGAASRPQTRPLKSAQLRRWTVAEAARPRWRGLPQPGRHRRRSSPSSSTAIPTARC